MYHGNKLYQWQLFFQGDGMAFKKTKFFGWLLLVSACLLFSFSCEKNFGQQLLYNKARNLHDRGHLDQAIEIYKKILATEGEHSEVNYDLGVAFADKGDMFNAKTQVEILRNSGRSDLADVLDNIIRDSNSQRVRKRLQGEYDSKQEK